MAHSNTDILFVSHRHDIVSGGEKALLDMIKHTVSIGLKPHVIIGSKGNIVNYLEDMKVPYTEIFLPFWAHSGNDPSPFHFTSLNPTVNTTRQIVSLIQTLKPKLCVTNTIVVPWLAYASSLTNTPHAWFIHELGTAGFNFRYAIGEAQTLRTVDLLSDTIFYNSRFTAEYYLPHFSINKKVRLVYPAGIPTAPETIESPFDTDTYKMIIVAQIKPQKGQLDAVKATYQLLQQGIAAQLTIVGDVEDAQYDKEIREYIVKHHLESAIIFLGHQKNPSSYIVLADVCLVCATNESFGRVAVESMFLGTPVIGANSAGTAEIIDSETIGLLYKPQDIDDFCRQIKRLRNNPKTALSIAGHAEKTVTKRYSETERYKQFVDYFNSLTDRKTALDLSPLASSFFDFTATVQTLESRSNRLESIEQSLPWRILSSIKGRFRR
jgi:L-malate glycosyltransferase